MSQTLTDHRLELHKALGMQEQICCNGGTSGNLTDGHQLPLTRPGSTSEGGQNGGFLPSDPTTSSWVHSACARPRAPGSRQQPPSADPSSAALPAHPGHAPSRPCAEDFALWTLIALWHEAQISNTKQGPPR